MVLKLISLLVFLSSIISNEAQVYLHTGRYSVPVDHFRPQDEITTDFHYRLNLDHYSAGGPLFIYINAGGVYTTQWIEEGLMVDIAHEVGGALFTTQHRFFGDNLPTYSASFSNLEYLTIEQSLADIAQLITIAKVHLANPNAKVVIFGSGYGGTLAAWAKQKYPHLIDGVWASSSVLEREVFTTAVYGQLVQNILNIGGPVCLQQIRETFEYIDNVLDDEDEAGLTNLQEELRLCNRVNTSSFMDMGLFSEGLINFIFTQNDLHHTNGIQNLCSAMGVIGNNPFASFARWVRFFFNGDAGNCFNFNYQDRLFWLSSTEWGWPGTFAGWRQSLYLVCTQLGVMPTTIINGVFGNRVTELYHFTACNDAFGSQFRFENIYPSIFRNRVKYGALNPSIPNAVFTNGNLDPFYSLGLPENDEEDSISILIPGFSKSADLPSITDTDSFALFTAKTTIRDRIIDWVTDDVSSEGTSEGTSEEITLETVV